MIIYYKIDWNKKSAIKLVELINHGWTTIREKGKITRLRMPICKVSSTKPIQCKYIIIFKFFLFFKKIFSFIKSK